MIRVEAGQRAEMKLGKPRRPKAPPEGQQQSMRVQTVRQLIQDDQTRLRSRDTEPPTPQRLGQAHADIQPLRGAFGQTTQKGDALSKQASVKIVQRFAQRTTGGRWYSHRSSVLHGRQVVQRLARQEHCLVVLASSAQRARTVFDRLDIRWRDVQDAPVGVGSMERFV